MDYALYLRAILSLVFVLGLLLVMSWAVKRFHLGAGGVPLVQRNKLRRMAVVETMALDGRRRLVLVRRDDVEHLILLGGTTETVIETRSAPVPEIS
jgi:flagellar protein FliO/FliZ